MRASIISALLLLALAMSRAYAQTGELHTGTNAFVAWTVDAPGVRRYIKSSDLPAPVATEPEKSNGSPARIVARTEAALPSGFVVDPLKAWQSRA